VARRGRRAWEREFGFDGRPGLAGPTRWTEASVRAAMEELTRGCESYPSRAAFQAAGLDGLHQAIRAHHGGHELWARRLGLPRNGRRLHKPGLGYRRGAHQHVAAARSVNGFRTRGRAVRLASPASRCSSAAAAAASLRTGCRVRVTATLTTSAGVIIRSSAIVVLLVYRLLEEPTSLDTTVVGPHGPTSGARYTLLPT
jgi:hypothetical protein